MNQLLDAQITEHEVEEGKTNEPEETHGTTMVVWDYAPTLGLDEEEPTAKIQLSLVNVTTRSKGPVMDEILILPKIKNIQETMKKMSSNTQATSKSDLVNTKDKVATVRKPINIVENKT